MERTIELDGRKVKYSLRVSKRARGIRLSVASGGIFTISAPPSVRQSDIEGFVHKKSDWVLRKLTYFRQFPKRAVIKNRRKHFAENKPKALALVQERLVHFNRHYGFTWNRVTIRSQRSRWGSCSRKGNLNFNYKIVLLPPSLADYLIVHELCHLGELNHSNKFWSLVAQTLPNHHTLRSGCRLASVRLL